MPTATAIERSGRARASPSTALERLALPSEEIIVVAPYNLQVRCLEETLLARVRVGTVDKFQGQEAPVVFFSLTTSSGENVPRNLEFLLSRNRLNVAISRARCLAYVVASPKLLEVGCRQSSRCAWRTRSACLLPDMSTDIDDRSASALLRQCVAHPVR